MQIHPEKTSLNSALRSGKSPAELMTFLMREYLAMEEADRTELARQLIGEISAREALKNFT